ncbi:hypothetical protein HanRHA438_Chr11g0528901 [Helianthus annuus]|nr:hypothetical protein HanRHA438_Chr11g0528901 [Helianthus annuus]
MPHVILILTDRFFCQNLLFRFVDDDVWNGYIDITAIPKSTTLTKLNGYKTETPFGYVSLELQQRSRLAIQYYDLNGVFVGTR